MSYFMYLIYFWPVLSGMRDLPLPGIELVSLQWKHEVLTAGPLGKSPVIALLLKLKLSHFEARQPSLMATKSFQNDLCSFSLKNAA